MTSPQRDNDDAIYAAQYARNTLTREGEAKRPATPLALLSEFEQHKYHLAAISGRSAELQPWHGDHTDLHYALQGADIEATDEQTSELYRSTAMDAIKAHAQVSILDHLATELAGDERALEAIARFRGILAGTAEV